MRRLAEIHDYRDLFDRLVGQHHVAHSSTVNAAGLNMASCIQPHHVVELRFNWLIGAEQILIAMMRNTDHQNGQGATMKAPNRAALEMCPPTNASEGQVAVSSVSQVHG